MDMTDILSTLTNDLIDKGKLTREKKGTILLQTIIYIL